MDKINSNVIDFSPAEGPAGLSVGQVYIDLDGTLKRGIFAGQSAASFEAVRQSNRERYAASGFVQKGKQWLRSGYPTSTVNEGLYCGVTPSLTNAMAMGNTSTYKVGASKVDYPILNITGVDFHLIDGTASTYASTWTIKFPQAPDGRSTYHKKTGEVRTHVDTAAAFIYANQSDNIEVITDRVDMWGFESFLEEVTTINPFIYQNGLIQSQAITMNGISTSESNRPVTYYAVFDGDTGSKGKGLDVTKLTFVQLATVLADPKNNLYYLSDGRLVQWRLRQQTIAGSGNGDWYNLEPQIGTKYLQFASNLWRKPQGIRDTTLKTTGDYPLYVAGNRNLDGVPTIPDVSLFFAGAGAYNADQGAGINGECYFLVCGTVNRLNQGAYHPSFNPSGGNLFTKAGVANYSWYQLPIDSGVISTFDCFKVATETSTGVHPTYGTIQLGVSGRPDGRFYDAVYAEGQGGVCRDMRYSALGLDLVDFAEADQRVKSGTYRGFEGLRFTRVVPIGRFSWSTIPMNLSVVPNTSRIGWGTDSNVIPTIGDKVFIGTKSYRVVSIETGTQVVVDRAPDLEGYTPLGNESGWNMFTGPNIVLQSVINTNVGGSFLKTDVIGNPANILSTPALAKGWQGSWLPILPDGVLKDFPVTSKSLTSSVKYFWSINNGASWTEYTPTFNTTRNAIVEQPASSEVIVVQYQAFASQTEPAANAEVYGKESGIGKVFQNSWHGLSTFQETLIGTVAKGNFGGDSLLVTKYNLGDGIKLHTDPSAVPIHLAIDLPTPINNSVGVKALNYNVNLNQQAFIQYAYTELKHNGTNWGDDGKVTIVDNQATKTDLNGNTVLVGTARLREPLGWLTQSSQPRNTSRAVLKVSFKQWTKAVKPLEEKGGIYVK